MSTAILAGDVTLYHKSENRQMRAEWSGAAADTRTIKELYLATQDAFDEVGRMSEGEPMSAQTPTDYTVGLIDAFETDPWFIDRTTVEHLEQGALQTASWARVQDSNTGIVRVPCTNTNIVAGDIGLDITHGDGDAGTLLDVTGTGVGQFLWIRPDSDAAANNFDSTTGTLTCNTHTATQTAAAATGESLWSGVFTQGNLENYTHIYLYQDDTYLTEYKSSSDWWGDGHIDKLFAVKEVGTLIDEGYVTVIARQFSKIYAYWIVDLSAGGRNAVPVTTGPDINVWSLGSVDHGYRQFTGSTGSGTFNEENWIYVGASWAAATKRGKLTQVGGTGAAPVLTYYLIGDLTDFIATDSIKEWTGTGDGDATCTAGAPSDTGPAALVGLSIVHGANNSFDIDEDGTNEYYSIVIDISDELVADSYPWSQYETRRGATGTTNTDGIEGEQYIGTDYRIDYTGIVGAISEGAVVTQLVTGATGTVVAHHLTPDILILRNSRGVFNNTNDIQVDGSNYVTGPTSTIITPIAAAPFGTFAGGDWYCAPGVVLNNVPSADTNNWNTVDDTGTARARPLKVPITIGNSRVADWISLWRFVSGDIKYDEYTVDATQGAAGSLTMKVDPAITTDEPATGRLVARDISTGEEHVYRYTSFTGDTFTLFGTTGLTADAGTDTDTIVDAGQFGSALVGDIIYNSTRTTWAYIAEVVSANEVTLDRTITGQTTGDSYTLGATVQSYAASDYVYVPFMLIYETVGTDPSPGSESTEITYSAPITALLRARNAAGTYNIKPFVASVTIGSAGLNTNIIRNPETIS